jgi:tetratricopeptide (TPR) repeat protein
MRPSVYAATLLVLALPLPGRAASYYCEAQGVYTNCTTEKGYETCKDQLATGGGAGTDRSKAETDAVVSCNTHMNNMLLIGNAPSGSDVKRSRSYIKSTCVVTSCKEYADGQAPAAGGKDGAGPDRADRLLAQGDELQRAGEFGAAIAVWQKASEAAPARPEPYAKICYALLLQGRFEEACAAMDQGVASAPDSEMLKLGRIECLIYRRRPQEAKQAAIGLLERTSDAQLQLGANLLGWIGASLADGAPAGCSGLVERLAAGGQAPGWDLGPLILFLTTYDSPAAQPLVTLLAGLQDNFHTGVAQLAAACAGA